MKKFSKLIALLTLAVCLGLSGALVACKKTGNPTPQAPEILGLSATSLELDMHESAQLTVTDAGDGTVVWRSSDNGIATVDDNGLVKSVAAGSAVVTATRGEKTGRCDVTVVNTSTAPMITLSKNSVTENRGQQVIVDATITYKSKPVTETVAVTWAYAEGADETVLTFTPNGNNVTLDLTEYGETTLVATATVWGIPVRRELYVKCCNTSVAFASTLEATSGGYRATVNPVANGSQGNTQVDLGVSVQLSGVPQDASAINWTSSDDSVAKVVGNKIVAGGAIGDAVLTGTFQGNFIKIFVESERAQITLDDTWVLDCRGIDKTTKQLTLDMTNVFDENIKGVMQEFLIPYDDDGSVIQRNIFKNYDTNTEMTTIAPPINACDMGKIGNAKITTSQAVYTFPIEIYTMVIKTADDLDNFGDLTKFQWSDEYVWDGYFVLGNDIKYNELTNLMNGTTCAVNKDTKAYTPFIAAKSTTGNNWNVWYGDGNTRDFDYGVGFMGIFDGCGHTIDGLFMDAPESEGKLSTEANAVAQMGYGGFIGALGTFTSGDTRHRGTIKNVSFINVVHGKHEYTDNGTKSKGTDGAFLTSASLFGIIENVYIDVIDFHTSLLSPRAHNMKCNQSTNFVVNIDPDCDRWGAWAVLGTQRIWGAADLNYTKNVFTVRKNVNEWGKDSSIYYNLNGTDSQGNVDAPKTAFRTEAALGEYLANNGLTVASGANWDKTFWTARYNGMPVPKYSIPSKLKMTCAGSGKTFALPKASASGQTYAWSTTDTNGVISIDTASGVLTANKVGSVPLVAKVNDTVVMQCTVVVEKEQINKDGKWELELAKYFADDPANSGHKTPSKEISVPVSDINQVLGLSGNNALAATDITNIIVDKYNYYNASKDDAIGGWNDRGFERTDTKDILIEKTTSGDKVKLCPPYRHRDGMGDGLKISIVTDTTIYNIAFAVYTAIIDTADELDNFKDYASYQWSAEKVFDGYYVLGGNITYNADTTAAEPRRFTSFMEAWANSGSGRGQGFIGVFDGQGYAINGFSVSGGGFLNSMNAYCPNSALEYERGILQNVAFVNAVHDQNCAFLYTGNRNAIIRNIYLHIAKLGNSGIISVSSGNTGVERFSLENIVVDITACNDTTVDLLLGKNEMWAKGDVDEYKGAYYYVRNIYAIKDTANVKSIDVHIGNKNNQEDVNAFAAYKATLTHVPDDAKTASEVATLLEENGGITEAKSWNTTYWETYNGTPIMKEANKVLHPTGA